MHVVRASLTYVSWKQHQAVAKDLRLIYLSATAIVPGNRIMRFQGLAPGLCAAVSQVWRRSWDRITPFLVHPPEIRKVIYTTNAIEWLNMWLRKRSGCGAQSAGPSNQSSRST